jgi:hypothetical protein
MGDISIDNKQHYNEEAIYAICVFNMIFVTLKSAINSIDVPKTIR